MECNTEEYWKKIVSSNATNNSTLSIHISPFEDCSEILNFQTSKICKNYFEMPRSAESGNFNERDPLGLQKELKDKEELEALNSMELSNAEYIDSLEVYDKSALLVAIVGDFTTPQESKTGKKKYLKGHLETSGHIIPFIVWDNQIPIHAPKIEVGHKLVIQNAYLAAFDQNFDKRSTVKFQVTLVQSSIVTVIGSMDIETISPYVKLDLEELPNTDGLVELKNAYVRTLPSAFNTNPNTSVNICTITDGKQYIEVRLPAGFSSTLNKGDPVLVKGLMNSTASPMFIFVNDGSNFSKKGGERLPIVQVLQANKLLQSNKGAKRKSYGTLDGASEAKFKKSDE
uniref:Uncharacterized protein n=1 Tax=Panagrolaimus sp. PS1159 TaxID=55785 RepID=A0AC35EY29_9BILA